MANSESTNTLKMLHTMKAEYQAIQACQDNINALTWQIKSADHDYEREEERVWKEYQSIAKKKAEQFDPAKEAAKTKPPVAEKQVRKKCLPHFLLVSALALIWIVVSFVILKQQLLPEQDGIGAVMFPRILYVVIAIVLLWMNCKEGGGISIGGGILYSIPAIMTIFVAMSNYDHFANVSLLRIPDIVLGGGIWLLLPFAPAPNKAYRREIEAMEEKKQKMLENIDPEAKAAYDERRYESEASIVSLRKHIAPFKEKASALHDQLKQEEKKIAAAEHRLLNSSYISLASLPSPPDYIERTALRNGQFAIDFMISVIDRGRADTLEEALAAWELEVKRQTREHAKNNDILNLVIEERDRQERMEAETRAKIEEAKRKQDNLKKDKEMLDRLEKNIQELNK